MSQSTEAPNLDLKASLKKPLQWAIEVGLPTALVTPFMPDYCRPEVSLVPMESKGIGGNHGSLASHNWIQVTDDLDDEYLRFAMRA